MALKFLRRMRARFDVTSLVAIIGLIGIVLTIAGTVVVARMEYLRRFADAHAQLDTTSFFLSDHANRLFEVAEVALEGSRALSVEMGWDEVAGSPTFHRQITSLIRTMPYIEDVWLNDTTGELRATSFAWPTPKSNAGDRENFKAAKLPVDELFIGPRIVAKVTGRPTFLLSRRLENADGSFRGMVSVTADISYFGDYWKGVSLPYDARVLLVRAPTAEVIAEFPNAGSAVPEGLARATADLPSEGEYAEADDGRFGHFRRVGAYPLYLAIDVSDSAITAGWRDWLLLRLPLPAVAIVLLAILTALAIRDSRREQSARRSLAIANSELTLEMRRRGQAEEQLRQLQKIEAIGQLTGGIAHDFNNMLAIIVGSLSLADRRLQRGEHDIGKYITSAQEGAQRAASLTQRLLAFARRQPLSPQVIDANRFVAGMSDLLQRTLTEAIQIETVLAAGLWKTHADAAQLENALVNLAVNARDAMPGGGRLTIETANSSLDPGYTAEHAGIPPGQYVLIAVTDTGSGMPPEVAARVFEPFYTTKGVGKGSGLGLSQVYGFVRQSGGHVKIYTELGQGTSVKIYLPRYYGEEVEASPGAASTAELPVARAGEVVLLVEDEPDVLRLSVETLRELGYTVVHVDRPAVAIEMINSGRRIDLLLTDIVMPDINGRQLADKARELRPDIKVLYMTGFTRNAVVHNGLLDPGVRLVGKPFSIAELAKSVREALDA